MSALILGLANLGIKLRRLALVLLLAIHQDLVLTFGIAFAITGTKWNGPRYFGLRAKQDRLAILRIVSISS
jgi:hypothetical protein